MQPLDSALSPTENLALVTVNIREHSAAMKSRGTINFINPVLSEAEGFSLGEIQQAAVRRSGKAGGRLSLAVHVPIGYLAATRRH
jgi:hypothetical protein